MAYGMELRLARDAARGHHDAVREVDELCDRVLGLAARRLARIPADAPDLLQEAKAHLVRPEVLRAYEGRGPLAGFVRIAGMRAMMNAERSADRRGWRERVAFGLEGMPLGRLDDALAAAEDRADPELTRALAQLPTRARQVVVAIAVLDLSYRETAAALGVPIGTVSSTYNRALATLRGELADHPGAPEEVGAR
ncbi:MAG: RNA polymerase sigma factor [Candidatus Nanopelagicales bacterium]